MFFPVSTTQPAIVCVKVPIASKNILQSEINTFDRIIWKRVVDTEYHISRNTNKCKDHMEIGRVNDFCPAFIHPDLLIYRLTVRAVTVPTGIVVEFKVPAVRTLGDVDPQCPGLAGKDGPGSFLLYKRGAGGRRKCPGRKVDVDGSGIDAFMSHKGFEGKQVGSVLIMISGKSMPKSMAGKAVFPSQFLLVGTDVIRDTLVVDESGRIPFLCEKESPGPFLYRQGIPVPEDELPGGLRELGVSGRTAFGRTDEDSSVGMFNIMAF